MTRRSIPPIARFERSPMTQICLDQILDAKPNDVLTYAALSEMVGDDVQHELRATLYSARKIALASYSVATGVVVGIGIKILDEAGAVALASVVPKRIYKTAGRGELLLASVGDPSVLDPDDLEQMSIVRLQLGIHKLFGRPQAYVQMRGALRRAKLPKLKEIAATTLALFE